MHKINQNHRASVVAHVTTDRVLAVGKRARSKKSQQLLPLDISKWKPQFAPDMHLGRRMETAQSASTLWDLKGTRKRKR